MRIHALFLLVLLVAIYEHQCEEETSTSLPESTTIDMDSWDWTKNYVEDTTMSSQTSSHATKSINIKICKSNSGGKSSKSQDCIGSMKIYIKETPKSGKSKKPRPFNFPVARYDRHRFPKFPPLVNFLPWLPIFVERRTKQTIIYSPKGGVYVLPPLVNFYGDIFSVGELISSGYASLVSTGAPPPPSVDIAPFVQTSAAVDSGLPTVNLTTGIFTGGVHTDFRAYYGKTNANANQGGQGSPQRDQHATPYRGYYW